MVAGTSFAPIRGRIMRVTRLDDCGAPVLGPASTRVSKGFVSVGLTPNYEKGTTITVLNAHGEVAFNEPADPYLSSMGANVKFTGVDPDLVSLITGNQTVVDGAASAVGFRLSGAVPVLGGWALEVWTDLGGVACATPGAKPYGYSLVPFLRGGQLDNFTLENGAASFAVTSTTRERPLWGTGPYDVVDVSSTPGTVTPGPLLSAVGAKDHYHLQVTTIAPPTETAGLVPLAAHA